MMLAWNIHEQPIGSNIVRWFVWSVFVAICGCFTRQHILTYTNQKTVTISEWIEDKKKSWHLLALPIGYNVYILLFCFGIILPWCVSMFNLWSWYDCIENIRFIMFKTFFIFEGLLCSNGRYLSLQYDRTVNQSFVILEMILITWNVLGFIQTFPLIMWSSLINYT